MHLSSLLLLQLRFLYHFSYLTGAGSGAYPIPKLLTDSSKNQNPTLQIFANHNLSESAEFLPKAWCGTSNLNKIPGGVRRRKRYILQGSRWRKSPVTFNITKYPPPGTMKPEMVDREISAAFRMWEEVSNLTFKREREGKVNIEIRFETGSHGDEEVSLSKPRSKHSFDYKWNWIQLIFCRSIFEAVWRKGRDDGARLLPKFWRRDPVSFKF